MTGDPPTPDSPTVEPSQPVQVQRLVNEILDLAQSGAAQTVIGLSCANDFLHALGLDIDRHGFITRGNGAYATPYTFDASTWTATDPTESSLGDYHIPESDVVTIHSRDRIHLSDLHTAVHADGAWRPVRDDPIRTGEMRRATGLLYQTVTSWTTEDERDDEATDYPIVHLADPLTEKPPTLTCLRCGCRDQSNRWEEDGQTIRCPACAGPWNARGLEHCTACGALNWFNKIDHGGWYDIPSCPECGADVETLESITYYDRQD